MGWKRYIYEGRARVSELKQITHWLLFLITPSNLLLLRQYFGSLVPPFPFCSAFFAAADSTLTNTAIAVNEQTTQAILR